jgi:hypothetical protein
VKTSEKLSLLRQFEPILKFSKGERFFPMPVEDYVEEASLWVKHPDAPPEECVPEKVLDLKKLGQLHLSGEKDIYYLRFISPMNLREMAEFRWRELQEARKNHAFKPLRSRLVRVGYLARFIDAVFSISLLLRGRVPGDSMAAAVMTYESLQQANPGFAYYGRVVQEAGWTILQYWFFYPFNNWRSGFYGANDHEADWEMINIYLYPSSSGEYQPTWLAFASHDFSGDDLRRHWDDPDISKVGTHPVVFVAGGSHASYFQQGEYLTQITLPFMTPLKRIVRSFEKFFGQLFREENADLDQEDQRINVFKVPFVDYAKGDGFSIGPEGKAAWSSPVLIDPSQAWVSNFRGLWGYFAQDPFSGEDAPAGPMYERNGTVRRAWFDPLGWAAMDKVIPPPDRLRVLKGRIAATKARIKGLQQTIALLQAEIQEASMDLQALQDDHHLQQAHKVQQKKLGQKRDTLAEKRKALSVAQTRLDALEALAASGVSERQNLRAHIQHSHQPLQVQPLRFRKLAEFWAAVSIGLMMIAVVLLVIFAKRFLLAGLVTMLLVLITVEAGFRKRLWSLTRNFAILLAVAAVLILMYEFFWTFLVILVMLAGFYMIIENLRELFTHG